MGPSETAPERGRMRGMKFSGILAVWLAMVAYAIAAHSEELKDVDCTGFALSYDGHYATQKCSELDRYGNQTEAVYKRLTIKDTAYEMLVTYAEGKFRTYFPEQSLRDQIEGAHYFSDTDNWQTIRNYGGFEVAVFEGYQKAGSPPILCAGFSRYSGNQSGQYEYPGGPGYPHSALGLYCAFSGQAALINPIDNFYRLM